MTITVRPVSAEETDAWVDVMNLAFLRHSEHGEAAFRRAGWEAPERALAALDGTRVVGTFRSFPTEVTLPGGVPVPADAITNVTVSPSDRRRGVLTAMMRHDLAAARDRGDPLAILIASEYPIYGRFGFGPAAEHATYRLDARAARFGLDRSGTVTVVDAATARTEAPVVYDRFRRTQPGSIVRTPRWWDLRLHRIQAPGRGPLTRRLALHRDDAGEVDGWLMWHTEERWEHRSPNSTLVVDDLVATSPSAYAALWAFCAEHDLIATVVAGDRSVDEALPWLLTDARAARQEERADHLWLRPLDVAAVLGARRYAADGALTIEVVDPAGLASGRYALDVDDGVADCRPTDMDAALTLPVDALSALVLGATSPRTLAVAGRIDVHDDTALSRLETMVRSSPTAWCNTWF